MFRGDDHEVDSEERIGAGSVHPQFPVGRGLVDRKINFCAEALTDPIGLHLFHRVAVVDRGQSFQEAVCIIGDAEIPLAQLLFDHGIAAAFADAADDLIVGQDRTQCLAPVDLSIAAVGQAVVHQDLLAAAVIIAIPGRCVEMYRRIAGAGVRGIAGSAKKFQQICHGTGLTGLTVIPTFEQLEEDPLRPLVI